MTTLYNERKFDQYRDMTLAERVVYHAVGGNHRGPLGWRGYYKAPAPFDTVCNEAVEKGWFEFGGQRGNLVYYYATHKGLEHVSAKSGRSYYVDGKL